MRIHFVTEGTLNEFWEGARMPSCDVLAFGFSGLGEVHYALELSGATSKLEDAAILSREAGCTVVSGCYTDSCGIRRKSAAVADKGRILGVSDMFSAVEPSEFKSGGTIKVYDTSAGKLGILIAEDLFFPEIAQMLSLCDADVLFSIFEDVVDFTPRLMLRADAFVAGVPAVMCGAGIAQVASATGEIALVSPKKECAFTLSTAREYHIVSCRRRGFCRRTCADF